MTREVVVLSGARTAIGGYGGSLKDIPPSELAAKCVREAVKRSGVEPAEVGHVVFGNIIHTDAHDHYLARVAGVNGGLPHETPALTLNRLCGSGLQAIITAAQTIMLGDADVTVAGGAENMSRSPYIVAGDALGCADERHDDGRHDGRRALSDPFDDCHMGVTAENVARRSRRSLARIRTSWRSRAIAGRRLAIDKGYFKAQIVPVEIKVKRDKVPFEIDETVRPGQHRREARQAAARCSIQEGTVTAGNASSINDAAAAVVLMDRELPRKSGV